METLVAAGLSLMATVLTIVQRAIAGDRDAQARLRRVEEVLSDSPTERVWAAALERAKAKPPALPPNPFAGEEE